MCVYAPCQPSSSSRSDQDEGGGAKPRGAGAMAGGLACVSARERGVRCGVARSARLERARRAGESSRWRNSTTAQAQGRIARVAKGSTPPTTGPRAAHPPPSTLHRHWITGERRTPLPQPPQPARLPAAPLIDRLQLSQANQSVSERFAIPTVLHNRVHRCTSSSHPSSPSFTCVRLASRVSPLKSTVSCVVPWCTSVCIVTYDAPT